MRSAAYGRRDGVLSVHVSADSLRRCLIGALEKNGLPYEEKLGTMGLPSLDTELQIAVQSWMGTGQLKTKGRAGKRELSRVITDMNADFRTGNYETNRLPCVIYLVLGCVMGVVVVNLAFM